ncbi:nucleoside recognition domain-containing protein [Halonatronum saccharophilum]|uniref:nucleoside recognition domain-containing protein n=1 Tax=Halonatronum saccharophilum TaxID=150060 RepID=UPI00048501DA|nr:nucleoside recognition domain-containing protein [Halonatronum saccharophilum]
MEWGLFFEEVFVGGFDMLTGIAIIIFPLLISVELAEDLGILDRISKLFTPFVKHFDLPKEAGLPLVVAQIFGLTYGAGVLLKIVDEDKLSSRELMIVGVFLAICHAVIEDTLLFIAIGGNWFIILTVRMLLALIVTLVYARYTRGSIINNGLEEVDLCQGGKGC